MSQSLSDRYLTLIDGIVDKTLQGKIASTERVYIMLQRGIEKGTGEIWERCLSQKIEATKQELGKKLKAQRVLRALETIETQYIRWQQANQKQNIIDSTTKQILETEDKLLVSLVKTIDLNQKQSLNRDKLAQLADSLQTESKNIIDKEQQQNIQQIAIGITRGLNSFSQLEDNLISWMYESNRSIGFAQEKPNPWRVWEKQIDST